MILPNKLIPYKDSILAKMVHVLDVLFNGDVSIENLYKEVKSNFVDINEFILTLDVLYVLERIEFDEKLKVVKHVKANNM